MTEHTRFEEKILSLLQARSYPALQKYLETLNPADIAECLDDLLDAGARAAARPVQAAQALASGPVPEYVQASRHVFQSQVRCGELCFLSLFPHLRAAFAVY